MKRLPTIAAAALLAGAGLATAHTATASADDQAAADAAIAAFNERMLGAGGVSDGPQDTEEIDPEEYEAENPGSECFGEFATGLDAGGRLEGETGRAFSDYFSFAAPEDSDQSGSDQVSAGIITVDEEHRGAIHDFVEVVGSGDVAACIEEAFTAMLVEEAAAAGTAAPEDPGSVEADAESDLGIGDASARIGITLSYNFEDVPYVFTIQAWVAAVDRTLVQISLSSDEEQVSDIDPVAELEALVDSI
jgi:hypothetical protein